MKRIFKDYHPYPSHRFPITADGTPLIGAYKLNVDGVLFSKINRIGVGFILRDWGGDILLVASINVQDVEDLATIESLAILSGLQHCLHQVIPTLTVESDC